MRPSRSLRRTRRRAPSLSDARPPAFTLAASLFRSLSISFRLSFLALPSLFFIPPFPLARTPTSAPCPHSLGFSSRPRRSRPSTRPHHFRSYRHVLRSSRIAVPLSTPLFPPRYITTLSRLSLARSSSNPPPARHLAAACIFAFFSLALSTLSNPPSLSLSVSDTARYFSIPFPLRFVSFFLAPSLSLSPPVSSSDQCFFARRLCIVRCLVCGTYIIQTCVRVRVHPGRPSRAHLALMRGLETRVFGSLRYAFMGEKKWADVSSALVTAACKSAATEGARTRHACTGSVEELLPFLSASFLYRPSFSNIFARYPLRRGI